MSADHPSWCAHRPPHPGHECSVIHRRDCDCQTPTTIMEIVKRRYETGEYGNTHFLMPAAVFDAMRTQVPTPPAGSYPRGRLPGYSLGDLMGIRIVIDDDLPEGTWRLVDTSTGEILFEGNDHSGQ